MVLTGDLAHGEKLPSVRSLARRLDLDPRTVHAAYRDLVTNGNVDLHRGSGAYVRRGTAPGLRDVADLQRLLHSVLAHALRAGFRPTEIRAAVAAWLAAPPLRRVVVIDMARETSELLVAELKAHIDGVRLWP